MTTAGKTPVLSLFCGAGGLDLGFSRAGFETVLAFDHNAPAVKSFNQNHRDAPASVADISKLTAHDVMKELGRRRVRRPWGIIGGPPCQGFSRGNVASDPRDPRNRLAFQFARLLQDLGEQISLKFFVFENVSGLLLPKYASRWKSIKLRFEKAGFKVFAQELEASSFGTPQVRRRVFLVGLNRSMFPAAEFKFPSPGQRYTRRTVADAIAHLPDPTLFTRGMKTEDVAFHENHWTMAPKSPRFQTKNFNKWRSFRKIDWDSPSPTVAYGNREIHVHPSGKRRLSILEAMLLQGFPQSYRLAGTLSDQVTQVSNAVPPQLARAVAMALRRHIVLRRNLGASHE